MIFKILKQKIYAFYQIYNLAPNQIIIGRKVFDSLLMELIEKLITVKIDEKNILIMGIPVTIDEINIYDLSVGFVGKTDRLEL